MAARLHMEERDFALKFSRSQLEISKVVHCNRNCQLQRATGAVPLLPLTIWIFSAVIAQFHAK